MAEPTITIRELVEEIDRQWQKGLSGDDAMRFLLPLTRKLIDEAASATARDDGATAPVHPHDHPFRPGDPLWTTDGVILRQWFVDQSGGFVELDRETEEHHAVIGRYGVSLWRATCSCGWESAPDEDRVQVAVWRTSHAEQLESEGPTGA